MSWNKQRRLEDACARVDFAAIQKEMLIPECLGVVVFEEDSERDEGARRVVRFTGAMVVEDDTNVKPGKYTIGGASGRTGLQLTVTK